MAIQNRYEFMYYVACTNSNPNGDPDMGNMPRIDPQTMQGFITDGAIDKGGELSSSSREAVMSEVRAHFKPEFLNRIDDIIIFKALQLEEIVKIVKLQIDSLNKRLETQNLRVELTKKAYEFLAEKAYDPSYGARPLKRVINEKIENPLARDIISGSLKPGDVRKFTEKDLA